MSDKERDEREMSEDDTISDDNIWEMPPDFTEVPEAPEIDADVIPGPCKCTAPSPPPSPPLEPDCRCPRDDWDIVIHEETCLMYKNETIIHPHEVKECECVPEHKTPVCECCQCAEDMCTCKKAGKEALEQWREGRDLGAMPAVLEANHPLMQKFQESLRRFLQKENDLAEQEIRELRDELKLSKAAYDKDLESIYREDHDTNGQRVLIGEFDETLTNERKAREEAEKRARVANEKHRECKEQLDKAMGNERESRQEIEALESLVRQLDSWNEDTESELTVSQRITEKMKHEKKARIEEKRQLDMIILSLNNEIWKLQSRIDLFRNQIEIKNVEMDKVADRVIAYSTELEDLELDKKRLISLWNSVLVNIKQRDLVFDSVREDYAALQENYRTLVVNMEITKKSVQEEMEKGKELAMTRDKLNYDFEAVGKLFEAEDERREELLKNLEQIQESISMSDRDQTMIKMENNTMRNILQTTNKECDHRVEQKLKLENEILQNLQECLLNDKAVEHMASGIKKMRDMSRNLEISLMKMENQHAKVMLDIEVHRNRRAVQQTKLEKKLARVAEREKEIEALQEKYDQKSLLMTRKQRELDIVIKKYNALKALFDMKSPQERRIDELEIQIKQTRDRTEKMQHIWLRLQGHVVRLTTQQQKLQTDISLINKQIQICEQKIMSTAAQIETAKQERVKVERRLRELQGRLEVLQRTKKESKDRNHNTQLINLALQHEYTANLKDGESEIIEMEEQIEQLDKEKMDLQQHLDRVQKEAMVWQRKGILAVELKRNVATAKSAAGEIGQMKTEIHRMEVRREQLRRTADKLGEDLATYILWRESALDKSRASAAVEKAKGLTGSTSQSAYKHKLRLAKADVQRTAKELSDTKTTLKQLQEEQAKLEKEVERAKTENDQLEENIATLLRECRQAERDKQYILERVVRNQRLGGELTRAVKRQSLRVRKPKGRVLADYDQERAVNDRLRFIVESLTREYPYLEEKLERIANTLNIITPTASPRLTDEAPCRDVAPGEEPVCFPEDPSCAGRCGDRCIDAMKKLEGDSDLSPAQ